MGTVLSRSGRFGHFNVAMSPTVFTRFHYAHGAICVNYVGLNGLDTFLVVISERTATASASTS